MSSLLREVSFMLPPLLLAFGVYQGISEKYWQVQHPVAPAQQATTAPATVPPAVDVPSNTPASDSSSPAPTSEQNAVADSIAEKSSLENPKFDSALVKTIYTPPSYTPSATAEQSSDESRESSSAEEGPAETPAEGSREPTDEEALATFFALMKKRRYEEADVALRNIELSAQISGDQKKIEMSEQLRRNLDALRHG